MDPAENQDESDYIKEMRAYEEERQRLLIEQEAQQKEMEMKLKMLEEARQERLKQSSSLSAYAKEPANLVADPVPADDQEFGETSYAQAESPMKKERDGKMRKWVAESDMNKLDQQLALEPKPSANEMTFGQTEYGGDGMQQTQQNWVKNKEIDAKGYLQVRFAEDNQFKAEEDAFNNDKMFD